MAQAALRAALGAFQESVWERKFADLAAGAAAAGASPAGALEAIRAIPVQCAGGRLLQRHALVALLKGTIPSRVSTKKLSLPQDVCRLGNAQQSF